MVCSGAGLCRGWMRAIGHLNGAEGTALQSQQVPSTPGPPALPPSMHLFQKAKGGFTSLQLLNSLSAAYKMNPDLSLKCSISSL